MSSLEKLIYLAGIVDGEGCFAIGAGVRAGVSKSCVNYSNSLLVGNTNLRLMMWLNGNFGGRCFKASNSNPNVRTCYIWRVLKREEIKTITLAILPYLIVKREQALVMLDFLNPNTKFNPDKRKALFDRMKALNSRGRKSLYV